MTKSKGVEHKAGSKAHKKGHKKELLAESKQATDSSGMQSRLHMNEQTEKIQVPGRKEQNIDETGISKSLGKNLESQEEFKGGA